MPPASALYLALPAPLIAILQVAVLTPISTPTTTARPTRARTSILRGRDFNDDISAVQFSVESRFDGDVSFNSVATDFSDVRNNSERGADVFSGAVSVVYD